MDRAAWQSLGMREGGPDRRRPGWTDARRLTPGRTSVVVGAAAALLYASTVVRGLSWDDAAELSAGIIDLGVVHQTGYPLYLLTGKAFTALVPLVPDVTATNLFSGAAAAVCVGLVAWVAASRTGSALAGVVAAAVLATGSLFWTHAVVASVYPLYLCTVAGFWAALTAWERRPSARLLALAGACAGALVVSHRTGIVFAAAAFLHLVLRRRERLRPSHLLWAVAAAGVPMLSLVYLPLRTGRVAFPDELADGGATVLQWVTGTAPAADAETLSVTGRELARNALEVGLLGLDQLSVATLLLVPLGLWAVRRDEVLLQCAVAPAVLISAVAVTTTGNYAYWHLPLLLVGALVTGCGAGRLAALLRGAAAPTQAGAALVTCAALVTSGVSGVAYVRSEPLDASAWARQTLTQVPPDAELESGWTGYTALRATQTLTGLRPDVQVTQGAYWVEPPDLDPRRAPLVAAVSQGRLRSDCSVTVRPLAPATPTNFKGLSNLRFAGVPLGYDAAVAQLVQVEPASSRPGCP